MGVGGRFIFGSMFAFTYMAIFILISDSDDGLVILSLASWPFSLATIFFCEFWPDICMSLEVQKILVITFGMLQYFLIGYLLSFLFLKNRS